MNIVSKLLVIVLFPFSIIGISGCEKNVGVSAESAQSSEGGEGLKVTKSNEFGVGKGAKANVSMPDSALITDAMHSFHPFILGTMTPAAVRYAFMNSDFDTSKGPMQIAETLHSGFAKLPRDQFPAAVKDIEAHLSTLPDEYKTIVEEKLKCAKLGAAGDMEKATACYWHYHLAGISA